MGLQRRKNHARQLQWDLEPGTCSSTGRTREDLRAGGQLSSAERSGGSLQRSCAGGGSSAAIPSESGAGPAAVFSLTVR